MTDQELFLKAYKVKGIDDFSNKTIPKVAFMFLVKGKVPLSPLWEKFFKDNEGFYSIYLHQDPSYKSKVHEDSAFYGRKVPSQKYCVPRCYSDEHYIPTFVHMMYPQLNSNRTITWVDWSIRGPHPRRYVWGDINDELMNKIRFGSTCVYNGKSTNICFLFGRKFHPNTLEPLFRVSPSLLGDYYP
ncbi:unnamed protein product [Lupinus luteus]|uniref:Uncharacterized protein n=1 Tax=Lupinus luteus TaxID=3873 RepID=A0AAV1XBF0_LUPLU